MPTLVDPVLRASPPLRRLIAKGPLRSVRVLLTSAGFLPSA